VLDGVTDPGGTGYLGVDPQAKHAVASDLRKKMIYDSPGGSIDQRFRLVPKYTLVLVWKMSQILNLLQRLPIFLRVI